MSMSNCRAGSSRQKRRKARAVARSTSTVWSPRWACVPWMAGPNRSFSRPRIASPSMRLDPLGVGPLGGDLLLQLHQAVEDRLRTGRAAGDVDVDRNDGVDPL